jgi:hypothetical protein
MGVIKPFLGPMFHRAVAVTVSLKYASESLEILQELSAKTLQITHT